MSQELTIVEACTEEHFVSMSLIHAEGWRSAYADAVPADYMEREITDDRWVSFFREDAQEGKVHGLLLYRGDTPVSAITYGPARIGASPRQSALLTFDSSAYEGWGEIISFYTHPEETGKGYGAILMDEALKGLKADGFENALVLALRENTGARRFYSRHGFTWDGTHEDIPFPHGTICVDLRYTKTL